MEIAVIKSRLLAENTYILTDSARVCECVVIDPGCTPAVMEAYLAERNLVPRAVLLTHGHFDHVTSLPLLQEAGAKVFIHPEDASKVTEGDITERLARMSSVRFTPDGMLFEGDTLDILGNVCRVIHTPGHTPGGVCYLIGDALFSGDTLFKGTYGRTDLGGGNFEALKNSIIKKLFILTGDITVYPGHGDPTALKRERLMNPILTDAE